MEVLYRLSYVGAAAALSLAPPGSSHSSQMPGGQSGLFTSVQPALVTVFTRVPQPSTDGSRPVTPTLWVRFETAGSWPIRTALPESPPYR